MAYTTIDDPTAYFQTKLYSGTGSQQSITNGGNSDLQPDFLWIKERDGTSSHQLVDSVRGYYLRVESDNDTAQVDAGQTGATNQNVTSFDSDGFGVKNGGAVNESGKTYVAWQWKKVAGVFDIQTYDGASNTRTISHNLGVVPKAMIFKRFDEGAWIVYHADSGGADKYLVLNTSAAVDTATTLFNNTVPTSSVFSVGNTNSTNGSGISYIVYLIGNKQGVSKCGSYTGNGNADGTFVYTGFKPAWVMVKNTETAGNHWVMIDNKRLGYNVDNNRIYADLSNAEDTTDVIDIVSNGFKHRFTGATSNGSGDKFIYMCFADNPFVTSSGVPATAR